MGRWDRIDKLPQDGEFVWGCEGRYVERVCLGYGGVWYGWGSCHVLTLDCRSVGLACIAIGFPVLSTDRFSRVCLGLGRGSAGRSGSAYVQLLKGVPRYTDANAGAAT